ncbi:phage late control D family protein [Streptomyces sp. bgisy027]|uniref:phage late control D family protein n=1 Tax=unclassified Streptomyces TaxID=2593676 RepID=UPI003D717E3F
MNADEAAPALKILCNGRPLPREARSDVESVTVQEDLHALSMFTVTLYDNWDSPHKTLRWADSELFEVGTDVEISLGYGGDLRRVMTGEVTGLEPAFTTDGLPMLTVRGYDYRHRLTRAQRTRTFSDTTDSAIAEELASKAGLGFAGPEAPTTTEATTKTEAPTTTEATTKTEAGLAYVVQNNQTDLEFLQRRARLIGYEVHVRDKVLHFGPPQHGRPAKVTLHIGKGVSGFTPVLRALPQVAEHSVRGWDVTLKEPVVSTVTAGRESTTMGAASGPRQVGRTFGRAGSVSTGLSVPNQERADQMARGQFDDMALTYITGTVECSGRPGIRAGEVVEIEGAGTRFSGTYYVVSVSHSMTVGNRYSTSLHVRRNAT